MALVLLLLGAALVLPLAGEIYRHPSDNALTRTTSELRVYVRERAESLGQITGMARIATILLRVLVAILAFGLSLFAKEDGSK